MADETIVAIYDTPAHAALAAADLKAGGLPDSAIDIHAETGETAAAPTAVAATIKRDRGFWSGLFGGEPDHDTSVYERSVSSGSTVVTVRAPEAQVSQVMQVLESHAPIDIDERAAEYALTQTSPAIPQPVAAAVPAAGDRDTLQLAEESLVVGKRLVNRGGTRVRRFVVETPVEQTVSLHEEKVILERHPVTDGRPVTDSFTDKTIEMMESVEEAVVSKTSRIVEEVALRKEAVERTETIRDTVRKEAVEIEQVPAPGATSDRAPKV